MCFSPLRRKTSEFEGEEYISRIVSGIDRLDPPLVSSRFTRLCTAFGETGKSADTTADFFLLLSAWAPNAVAPQTFGETGKSADWLAQIQPSSRCRHRSTNIRPM
jgi:hypothetical protein